MNSFRAFLLNPNIHGIVTALLGVAALVPGPQQAVAGILTPVWAGITTALPETPVINPNPVVTMPALPTSGSLHSQDYVNIATAVVAALATPKETAGRS